MHPKDLPTTGHYTGKKRSTMQFLRTRNEKEKENVKKKNRTRGAGKGAWVFHGDVSCIGTSRTRGVEKSAPASSSGKQTRTLKRAAKEEE